jgi:hypothetical protein
MRFACGRDRKEKRKKKVWMQHVSLKLGSKYTINKK